MPLCRRKGFTNESDQDMWVISTGNYNGHSFKMMNCSLAQPKEVKCKISLTNRIAAIV
jgi:hypothetical protein